MLKKGSIKYCQILDHEEKELGGGAGLRVNRPRERTITKGRTDNPHIKKERPNRSGGGVTELPYHQFCRGEGEAGAGDSFQSAPREVLITGDG